MGMACCIHRAGTHTVRVGESYSDTIWDERVDIDILRAGVMDKKQRKSSAVCNDIFKTGNTAAIQTRMEPRNLL